MFFVHFLTFSLGNRLKISHLLQVEHEVKPEPIKLGISRYACPFCAKIQPTPQKMKVHIRTHTGEQPFICPYCHLAFTQEPNCQRHIVRKHNMLSNDSMIT